LNRIAQFRQRLDALPRLTPGGEPPQPPSARPPVSPPAAGSRTQALLGESLQHLASPIDVEPSALSRRALRLLADARGLVGRMRAVADDPVLAGAPAGDTADPLAVHYQETAALTEAAVRYVRTFPPGAAEQARLCDGLEGMIDAARRRIDILATCLERRRADAARIDVLARFLWSLYHATGPLDPDPLTALADSIVRDEPGRPLRLLYADPTSTQAYLGSPDVPAPARFVAAHGLNVAAVLARVARADSDWRDRTRELVLAGLVHDVGMVGVESGLLATPGPLDAAGRRVVEAHARMGADRIVAHLPGLSGLAEVAATHHERTDGGGYPAGLNGGQVSPVTQLVAAADVYAAECAPRPYRPAHDPRAALTDVLMLAEHGRLDRYAADKLLALGTHPAGSVVELSDGWTAVVLEARDPRAAVHAAARPLVALLVDPDGRALPTPRYVDLAAAGGCSVVRTRESIDRLRLLGRSYPEWV
jgi:HD-GYP domain-containing protein (c-di-GMP phosphodiesterase class II)